MVPHGMSVSLTAPEAFRFGFAQARSGVLRAAAMLAPDQEKLNDAGEQLPTAVVELMRDIDMPNGIGAVGYTESDIARSGARDDEAAAPAGHVPAPGQRGGHRPDLRPVHRELVTLRRRAPTTL